MPRKSTKIAPPTPKLAPPSAAKSPVKAKRRVARQQAAPASTKAATVLAALQQPQGATLLDLTKVTGWQPHSVRGFLSGTVRKRLGLTLTVEHTDGERRYHIA